MHMPYQEHKKFWLWSPLISNNEIKLIHTFSLFPKKKGIFIENIVLDIAVCIL